MKTVQHDEVKQGMTIKQGPGSGRWVTIERVIETRPGTASQEPVTFTMSSYLNGKNAGQKFQLALYSKREGYELHPESAFLAAKGVMRAGRADVKNIVIREYTIKMVIVDRVDNQGMICGYCETRPITSNIYATVFSDASGRREESAWPTCAPCEMYSIDGVEDVDPSHTVTIERTQR